jgi:hypothetical protein
MMKKFLQVSCILIFLVQMISKAQCLSGVYTIGGTSPAYTTLTDAVDALVANGVCGPVTFDIRPGTYTESLTIPDISGTSFINRIVFKSENGIATSVSITSAEPSTIYLNGADYVRFSRLSISNSILNSGTTLYVLKLGYNTDNVQITDCRFVGATPNDFTTSIYSFSETSDSLSIQNSIFTGNRHAISIGTSNPGSAGTLISNNEFTNQYFGSLLINNVDVQVLNNTFKTNYSGYGYAVELSNSTQKTVISNNKITSSIYSSSAFKFSNCDFAIPALISNNFIRASGSEFNINGSKNIKIYHNTVKDSAYQGIVNLAGTLSKIEIKNNIFVQSDPTVIYKAETFDGVEADANILSSYGGAIWEQPSTGKVITSLMEFNDATGMDVHSSTDGPQFVDYFNYHIASYKGINPFCAFYPETAKDLDGDLRSTTHPFYGADEFAFTPQANDAGIVWLSHGKEEAMCGVDKSICIKIRNYGSNNLTATTIKWFINGIAQPNVNWTGNIGNDTVTIVLNSAYNFDVKKNYKIDAYINSVNTVPDQNKKNDSLFGKTFMFYMKGSYTIGGNTPDYATIKSAIADLKKYGICSPVVFMMRAGTYTDTSNFDAPITGSSALNSITFQSSSGKNDDVIIEGINKTHAITIFRSSYLVFNNLTFKNDSVAANNVLVKQSSSSIGLTFRSCVFKAAGLNVSLNGDEQNDLFENCVFTNTSLQNIYVRGNQKNVQVTGCVFHSPLGTSIVCESAQQITISKNTFKNCAALLACLGTDFTRFENNSADSVGYGPLGPVRFSGANNISFNYNKLPAGLRKSTVGNPVLSIAGSKTGINEVMNNVLQQPVNDGTGNALYVYDSKNISFYHNTVIANSSNTTTAAVYFSQAPGCVLKNNLFIHAGRGYAVNFINTINTISDNNDLFTQGVYLGSFNSSTLATLNNWQSAAVLDQHSLSLDPGFVSPLDVHIQQVNLREAGAYIGKLPIDLDGKPRDLAKPDLGAYVFNAPPLDAGMNTFNNLAGVCEGAVPVTVHLKNYGSSVLKTLTVKWTVNNVLQPVHNLNLNMTSGADTLLELGTIAFQNNVHYDIKTWCENPNGGTDAIKQNDSLSIFAVRAGLKGNYIIGGTNADYKTIADAVKDLNTWGICGPVEFIILNGIYKEQFSIQHVNGASRVNTVRFNSESNDKELVQLQADASATSPYIMELEDIGNITFENISFISTNNSWNIVSIEQNCSNLVFRNCNFKKTGSESGSGISSLTGISGLGIYNNTFDGGDDAVHLERKRSASNDSIYILDNTFLNYSNAGIACKSASGMHIRQNKFISSVKYTAKALNLIEQTGSYVIERNVMNGSQTGIYLINSYGNSTTRARVANNMVNISGMYGFYAKSVSNTDMVYNTINNSGSLHSSSAFSGGGYKNVSNLNNIYSRVGGSVYAFTKDLADSTGVVFDNNDYYSPNVVIANWLLIDITSFADFKTFSKQDFKSVSVDPLYKSINNLHIRDNNSYLNAAGAVVTGVTIDIDGDLRGTSPDIGADEYTYIPPTGITQPEISEGKLQVYPNPSTGKITIRYALQDAGYSNLQLMNNLGQTMYTVVEEQQLAGIHSTTIDIRALGLSNGIYVIRLNAGGKSSTIKLLLME